MKLFNNDVHGKVVLIDGIVVNIDEGRAIGQASTASEFEDIDASTLIDVGGRYRKLSLELPYWKLLGAGLYIYGYARYSNYRKMQLKNKLFDMVNKDIDGKIIKFIGEDKGVREGEIDKYQIGNRIFLLSLRNVKSQPYISISVYLGSRYYRQTHSNMFGRTIVEYSSVAYSGAVNGMQHEMDLVFSRL